MEQDNILIIKYPHPHFKPQANYSDEIDEDPFSDEMLLNILKMMSEMKNNI